VECPGVAGGHLDDGAEDFGLAFGCPAWPGGPAVLGDHQGQVAQAGGSQYISAMCFEEGLDGRVQSGGRDRAEYVREEVEADVVEVGDELLSAGPGEIGEEGGVRAEQWRAVAADLQARVPTAPGLVLGGTDSGDERVGDPG
jgi:hypothetical protein